MPNYDEKIAGLKAKLKETEEKRRLQVVKILEKHAGKITDLQAWENYVKQYASYIKKTQSKTQ